jgi:hypothetical protein
MDCLPTQDSGRTKITIRHDFSGLPGRSFAISRALLDWALAHDVPIDPKYPLKEAVHLLLSR